MKYFVTIGARTHELEVAGERVVLDGEALEAHLAALPGTPLYHLLLGGASWTVAAEALEGAGRWALGVVGERVEVRTVDERTRRLEERTAAAPAPAGGPATVVAPMPGLVARVAVAPGQRVEAGAGLVVIEAMKMENELVAPRAGVVETVHVAPGAAVEKGAPLVTLASPEARSSMPASGDVAAS